jgi:hypothetical protein
MSDDTKFSALVDKMLTTEQKAAAAQHLLGTEPGRDSRIKNNSDRLERRRKQRDMLTQSAGDIQIKGGASG